MNHIIDSEPYCHGEETCEQVWQDAMTEEYQFILKNDVWDIVLRPDGKSVVTSKWIYKIKHAADGNVEKYKARSATKGICDIHVYMLKKVMYGLKQAPRAGYEKMDGFLMSLDFSKSVADPNPYYHIVGNKCLILVLYVDDLFLAGS
jgi:hypothetical protein